MKRVIAFLLVFVCCFGLLAACGGKEDYVPAGHKRISHDNADYYLYVPTSWIADLSTGVTAAYVSEKDRSSISFMVFEVEDTLIQAVPNALTEDSESSDTTLSDEATDSTADTTGTDGLPAITTVEEYWAYYQEQFAATFSDMTYSVEGENRMLAGMKAKQYVYTATVTGEVYEFMQVVALHAGTVYIFTYTSTEANFDTHLEAVNQIIEYISLK